MSEVEVKADDRQLRAALDRDPPTCPEDEIKDIAAARVVLAGRGVTRSPVPP